VLRAWLVLLGLLAILAQTTLDGLAERLDGEDAAADGGWTQALPPWTVLVAAGSVFVLAVAGYAVLAWHVTGFRVADGAVEMKTGVLMRRRRQMRLDRLQSVDVVRPLTARLVGLAQLELGSAGGGSDSGLTISFLRLAEAAAVRRELLARSGTRREGPSSSAIAARGDVMGQVDEALTGVTDFGDAGPVGGAAEGAVPLFAVPPGRTLASVMLSGWAVGLVATIVSGAVLLVVSAANGSLLSTVLAVGGGLWGGAAIIRRRLMSELNFSAQATADGVVVRHGLTELVSQTVRRERIQAVEVSQPLLWRHWGWWRVRVNVAGYGTQGTELRSVVLPVGTFGQVASVLWSLTPTLVRPQDEAMWRAATLGRGPENGFTVAPRRARWLDPWGWRRLGYAVTPFALVVRKGLWVRRVQVVPHERTQGISVEQGPWQSRFRLASVRIASTVGPVVPELPHLDVNDAGVLLRDQAIRARMDRGSH
jgi:putative membrane protein